MAEQALAPMLDGKKPDQIATLKIMDSACGSGSFLIGAYNVLLQAILRYWTTRPSGARKGLLDVREGQVHLTLRYRRESLVNCILGIDIDPQAVEVAQLSLYLKLLEDETTFTARQQQLELGAALLPSLTANIVVANSLLTADQHSDLFADGDTKAVDNFRCKTRVSFRCKSTVHRHARQCRRTRASPDEWSFSYRKRSVSRRGSR